ncbi:MAG: hypothetical protein KGL51_11795 [Betaproteobacteria bacterium]|nr:hypothetical protein [Betaproteobacteria bacterium]
MTSDVFPPPPKPPKAWAERPSSLSGSPFDGYTSIPEGPDDHASPFKPSPLWRRVDWLLLGTWIAALAFSLALWALLAYTALSLWRS